MIAYLIRRHNMTYDAALRLVKEKRRCVKPNAGFERTLREWEAELRAAGAGSPGRPGMSRHATTGSLSRPEIARQPTAR